MRPVPNIPTGPGVPPCHRWESFEEFLAGVSRLYQWEGQDMWMGECKVCGSTIAWVIRPTRYPEENPTVPAPKNTYKQGKFVPLEELTDQQLVELPRSAFTDEEWAKVKLWVQKAILEEDSERRVDFLANEFISEYRSRTRPTDADIEEAFEGGEEKLTEDFTRWLEETYNAERPLGNSSLLNKVAAADRQEYRRVLSEFEGEGHDSATIRREMEGILSNLEAYEIAWGKPEIMTPTGRRPQSVQSGAVWKRELDEIRMVVVTEPMQFGDGIPGTPLSAILDEMTDREIVKAIKRVDDETDNAWHASAIYPRVSMGTPRAKLEVATFREKVAAHEPIVINHRFNDDESPYLVYFKVDWGYVERSLQEEMPPLYGDAEGDDGDEGEDEGAEGHYADALTERWKLPLEDRIVYRFKDGIHYAVELTPTELTAEGARDEVGLWHCIGNEVHRFPWRLRNHKGRIWSIRRPKRSKKRERVFSVYAKIDQKGNPVEVEQFKGLKNRLPGWNYTFHPGNPHGPIQEPAEVTLALEFLKHLRVPIESCDDVRIGVTQREGTPGWKPPAPVCRRCHRKLQRDNEHQPWRSEADMRDLDLDSSLSHNDRLFAAIAKAKVCPVGGGPHEPAAQNPAVGCKVCGW